MATLQADMMGNPFDPELAVIIKSLNGGGEFTLEGGLEPDGHNIWRASGMGRIRYNQRGVPIVDANGVIQRPPESMAVNVNPPASFEKFDPKEEAERQRKEAITTKARGRAPAIKPDKPMRSDMERRSDNRPPLGQSIG